MAFQRDARMERNRLQPDRFIGILKKLRQARQSRGFGGSTVLATPAFLCGR